MIESVEERRVWMGVLARAKPAKLAALMAATNLAEPYDLLRAPETGLIMVRGRIGGEGAPSNLGEMTVTRCSVTLASGAAGHSMVAGRDEAHAANAALVDALMADETRRAEIIRLILTPLVQTEAAAAEDRARASATTKVDFFTVARGEDAA